MKRAKEREVRNRTESSHAPSSRHSSESFLLISSPRPPSPPPCSPPPRSPPPSSPSLVVPRVATAIYPCVCHHPHVLELAPCLLIHAAPMRAVAAYGAEVLIMTDAALPDAEDVLYRPSCRTALHSRRRSAPPPTRRRGHVRRSPRGRGRGRRGRGADADEGESKRS
jgi:hypothetical protein